MEVIHFVPRNVCSVEMYVYHEDGIIQKVQIIRGCPGNTQGVAALLVGMSLEEAVKRLEGIQCRNGTSCPDQLAKGIKHYLNK
jgi:uncharacterized protein (TIGR03905 family)